MVFSILFFRKLWISLGLIVLVFLPALSASAETLNYEPPYLSTPQYVRCFFDPALFFLKTPEYCGKVIFGYEYSPTLNTIQPTLSKEPAIAPPTQKTTNLNSKIPSSSVVKSNSNTASFLDETPLLFALRSLLTKEDIRLQLQGPAGPQGIPGPQGNPGSSTTQIATAGYSGITPYLIPSNPTNNFSGASLFGVTDLSSTNFISDKATVKESLTVNGPTQINSGLTVSGTITGNITGTINPSFTANSVPFQGISGLVEDTDLTFSTDTLTATKLVTNSVNGLTLTSSTGALTIANGKTLTASNSLTFTGTDSSTLNIGTGGTLGSAAYTASSAYEVPVTFGSGVTRTVNSIVNDLITGKSGGQTIFGDISANGDLTIEGTSNATKTSSYVILQPTSGNVGIGTMTPLSTLHVAGTTAINWGGGADSYAGVTLGTGGTTGGSLWVNTQSVNSTFQSGLGVTGSYNGGSQTSVVNINAYGVKSAGGYGSVLAFSTTSDATLSEKMRINSAGNVGIGTTTLNQQFNLTKSIEIPTTTTSATGVIYKGINRFIHNFTASGTNGLNTFVGINAGNFTMAYSSAITDASANVGIGDYALYNNTTGHDNTAVGLGAMISNTTGYWNTGIGMDALYNNTTGWQNTAMGQDSMLYNTTGYNNVSIGSDSMYNNIDGYSNVSLGNTTLNKNVSGYANTALGIISLFNNTTGDYNTGLGYYSGFTNSTGNNNVFLGAYAGYYETGSNKLFIDNAQRSNEADGRVKALVYGVFDSVVANQIFTVNGQLTAQVSLTTPTIYGGSTANDDITIEGTSHATKTSGYVLLQPNGGANSSVIIGGTSIPSGAGGKFIIRQTSAGEATNFMVVSQTESGTAVTHNSRFSTEVDGSGYGRTLFYAASNSTGSTKGQLDVLTEDGAKFIMALGPRLSGTGQNNLGLYDLSGVEKIRFNTNGDSFLSGGNLGVGQSSPASLLHVGSTSVVDATNLLRLQDANSTCDFNANAGSPSCGSDATLKKDVTSLTTSELLSKVSLLNPVSYRWLTEDGSAPLQNGFIAQEVELQFPDLVSTHTWIDGSQKKFLNTGGLMPYVVGAVKELNIKMEALATGVADIFANRVHTKELCVGDGTGSETCITKAQLDVLLQGNSSASASAPVVPVDISSVSNDPVVNPEEEDPIEPAPVSSEETAETQETVAPSESNVPQEVAP